jgi:glucose 1-dehydrogenase
MRLAGKLALVTGAGGGIGRGIAERFAEEGAKVAVADIDGERAHETAALIGSSAVPLVADVSRRDDVQALLATTLELLGGLDILVNNAGILTWGSILDLPEAEWDRVMAVNLKSMYLCTQEVARYWVGAGRRGRIVNLASLSSELAIAGQSHYCASKGGVKMFTRATALDLAPHSINVNAVAPGNIPNTNIIGAHPDPAFLDAARRANPWGRVGEPRDVANAALFLVSDEADYITGHTLFVDGGRSAAMAAPQRVEPPGMRTPSSG